MSFCAPIDLIDNPVISRPPMFCNLRHTRWEKRIILVSGLGLSLIFIHFTGAIDLKTLYEYTTHRTMDCKDLGVDEACLNVTSNYSQDTWLYALPSNCLTCPYSLLANVTAKDENVFKLSTKHAWTFRITNSHSGEYLSATNESTTICDVHWNLGAFGEYDLVIGGDGTCDTNISKQPVNIYLPLIIVSCLLLVIGITYKLATVAIGRYQRSKSESKDSEADEKVRKRVVALDTFRGISILLMIFVNDGAGGYEILEHAVWNGLQLADLVFPWFVWIMGVCIPISIKSQIKKNVPRIFMVKTIIRRSIVLFGIGIMLNTLGVGPQLETLRIFGVFQRFGVLYLVVASSCALLWPRSSEQGFSGLRDIVVLIPQWILQLSLHIAHLLIIFLLYVPGCPKGYLGPGGISEDGIYSNCTGGATGYIDMQILGPQHLYQWPSSKIVYKSGPFDPEGPYGCLPSLLCVMLGVQAGSTLISFPGWKARAKRWVIWGAACLVLGIVIAVADAIPVNKNLWSTSYTLVTCGLAFLLLAFCYLLIDVWEIWEGAPFVYPGMNPTIMYVGHMVAYQLWPFHWRYGDMDTHMILLVEDIWGVAAWTFVAFRLYSNKFFLSI